MKTLFLTAVAVLCFAALAVAQDGTMTSVSDGPPYIAYQNVYGYSGTNLIYICTSRSRDDRRAATVLSISAATNANPVVLTSTAHGFNASSRPEITITGGTGNWAAINGTFTATIVDANSFSIPVNSGAFGALAGTIRFTTRAPRTSVAEWAVKRFVYDGSNNLIFSGWDGGSSGMKSACAASTTSNLQ